MKKFQFGSGAVTPQSKPVQFEYKPLGLEAFAQPLAQKQARYDTVTKAIEDADLSIGSLNPDDKRSSEISEVLNGKKNELLGNLNKTKNFKEAAKKLSKLNKVYNSEAEIVGIKTQKAAFAEADKKAKERIDGIYYTEKDYKEWYFKTLNEYTEKGGYSYDGNNGSHNSINVQQRGRNQEKEIMDMSLKTASMEPEQIYDYITKNTEFSSIDKDAFLKTVVKNIDKEKVAQSVQTFLKQSERYKDWVNEDAEYEFYNRSRNEPGFVEDVIKNQYKDIDSARKTLNEYLVEGATNPDGTSITGEQLKEVNESLLKLDEIETDFIEKNAEAVATNNLLSLGETLFKAEKNNNRIGNIAGSSADLVDLRNTTNSLTFQDTGLGKKGGALEKVQKIDDYQINTQISYAKGTPFVAGGSASNDAEKHLYDELSKANTVSNLNTNTGSLVTDRDAAKANLQSDTDYAKVLSGTVDYWDKKKDDLNLKLIDLTTKLDEEQNGLKKKEITSEIKIVNGDIREARVNEIAEFYDMDRLFEEASIEKNSDGELVYPWIIESLRNGGRKQLYDDIYKYNNDLLTIASEHESNYNNFVTKNINNQDASSLVNYDNTSSELSNNTDIPIISDAMKIINSTVLPDPTGNGPGIEPYKPSETNPNALPAGSSIKGAKNILYRQDDSFEFTKDQMVINDEDELIFTNKLKTSHGGDVFNEYRKLMSSKYASMPTEIKINEQSNNFTNDALAELVKDVKNNEATTSNAALPVKYDPGTNKFIKRADAQTINYDINNYTELPAYVGASENGQQQVLRYNRKTMSNGQVKSILATKKYGSSTVESRGKITNNNVDKWRLDNPQELFLSVEGTSTNIEREANKTYTDVGKASIELNDANAYGVLANSYAEIALTTNQDRRLRYGELTTRLNNMFQTEDVKSSIPTAPAYWNDNNDGTFSGNQITYRYDPDQQSIVADIKKLTYGKDIVNEEGMGSIKDTDVSDIMTHNITQLNAAHIYAMDILYGAGDEDDMPKDSSGSVFVPAWYNPKFVQEYKK